MSTLRDLEENVLPVFNEDTVFLIFRTDKDFDKPQLEHKVRRVTSARNLGKSTAQLISLPLPNFRELPSEDLELQDPIAVPGAETFRRRSERIVEMYDSDSDDQTE